MRQIVQGEQQTFVIQLSRKQDNVQFPFDLTGYTEIQVCFKSNTTIVEKDTSSDVTVVGPDTDGKIQAILQVADTESFQTGKGDIEVVVTKPAGEVTKWQIPNSFQVSEAICP